MLPTPGEIDARPGDEYTIPGAMDASAGGENDCEGGGEREETKDVDERGTVGAVLANSSSYALSLLLRAARGPSSTTTERERFPAVSLA